MFKRNAPDRKAAKLALSGLVAALIAAGSAAPAQARHHHHARHFHRHGHVAVAASPAGVGGTAAIVVDGATGRMIYGMNETAPRHPASVTKVMTLYLLFEALEKGKLGLDDEIAVSAHAAAQSPSKLGLRPGQTIRVEDAIKAIVTKSANDIAVAVAEALGGTESEFAEMMTRKAHALGMARTFYRNASGLPNDEQITTAADLALLGRSIQANFPRYYRFFSLHEFAYHGQRIHTHNHLMDRCEGMDGIKTGYTVASGFNLLSSVKRDGHYIVSVVMGGKSARARDNYMESLIERHIAEGGSPHGFARVAETGAGVGEASSYAPAPNAGQGGFNWWGGREEEPKRADAEPKPGPAPAPAPVRSAAAPASQPAPEAPRLQVAAVIPPARPRPAYVSAAAQEAEGDEDTPSTAAIPRHRAAADGSTSHAAPASASAVTPSAVTPGAVSAKTTMRVAMVEPPARPKPESGVSVLPRSLPKDESGAKAEGVAKTQPPAVAVGKPSGSGWVIQIGATEDAGKAAALLSKAKSQKGALLASAQPFTETVRKGNETFYRARFAGLEESKAEAACKALKNSGFSCFASRN